MEPTTAQISAFPVDHPGTLIDQPPLYETVMASGRWRAPSWTRLLGFRPDFIEHQLAHAVRDPNGRAYNRTAFLPEWRVMMQEWADYLDRLRAGRCLA